jgi:hypothetical protein
VVATKSTLDTANARKANAQHERDAAISAFNQVLPLYTQAYNAAIERHRRWYCLWLCKPKHTIDLPVPAPLAGAAMSH